MSSSPFIKGKRLAILGMSLELLVHLAVQHLTVMLTIHHCIPQEWQTVLH